MHMMVSDTVVLSDNAYHSRHITNSYYPFPNVTFFSNFPFFISYLVFVLLRVFDHFRLAVNVPGSVPRGHLEAVPPQITACSLPSKSKLLCQLKSTRKVLPRNISPQTLFYETAEKVE